MKTLPLNQFELTGSNLYTREDIMFILGNVCLSTGGYPIKLTEVASIQLMGVHHPANREGVLPHPADGGGYPHPASTCYAVGSMPLAFTQEDFLVMYEFVNRQTCINFSDQFLILNSLCVKFLTLNQTIDVFYFILS